MRSFSTTLLILATLCLASNAKADLIGDTILYQYLFPDLSTPFDSQLIVVEAGTADTATTFFGIAETDFVTVNPESNSIEINFEFLPMNVGLAFEGAEFNGIEISDLDFSNGALLNDVLLTTDFEGLDESRLTFGEDFVAINLESLIVSSTTSSVSLQLISVPEPNSVAMLAIGLGFFASRRKRTSS